MIMRTTTALAALTIACSVPLSPVPARSSKAADVAAQPSPEVTQMVGWVLASADNGGRAFIIIDKVNAQVLAFDGNGVLMGRTPALIGSAVGDFSKPGIGDRELRNIAPEERTTPAGRFTAGVGPAPGHRSVLWVDFKSAVALHAVVTANKSERRIQRLQSATSEDNRITYGCINVSRPFYDKVVRPLFTGQSGVVYILPETLPLNAIFPAVRPVAYHTE